MIRLRIDELLEERGKSAYWLANEIRMGHGNLWTYRKGRPNTINLEKLEAMCRALDCKPGDLLVLDNRPEATSSKRRKTTKLVRT